jgi:hypothetical protein
MDCDRDETTDVDDDRAIESENDYDCAYEDARHEVRIRGGDGRVHNPYSMAAMSGS